MVLNLSCPNTNETKTFENPELFSELAHTVAEQRKKFSHKKPVLIKLSPDLETGPLHAIIELALKFDFDGFVLTNTTTRRDGLKTPTEKIEHIGRGGLSGAALTALANDKIKQVYEMVGTKKIIMAVGGILSFQDLLTKLKLGASLFQVYTGMIYHGPFFIKKLNQELVKYCEKCGARNYAELVGKKL
jgi:dihydroorotate dehydrogenase